MANAQQVKHFNNLEKYKNSAKIQKEAVTYDDSYRSSSAVKVPFKLPEEKKITSVNYSFEWVKIGLSNYGLQTNASIPRRIQVYSDGKVSAVWTTSPNSSPWTTRGSGYNHFDGSDWFSTVTSRIEMLRTGWPNLTSYDNGTNVIENVLSHYSNAGGSGGYSINTNDGIGSTVWAETEKDNGTGPIWPRTATSGDYLYVIGNYSDTLIVKNNVKRPMVFSRYDMKNDTWVDDKITLPGYNDEIFSFGSGDVYSMDVKDNVVAILVGGIAKYIVLWKSLDYGDTWERTIIDSFVWPEPKFQGDTITFRYNDGAVNVLVDDNKVCHAFWGTLHGWDFEPGDGQYYPIRNWSRIEYFNDISTNDSMLVNDTIWKDTTVYRLYVDNKVANKVTFMNDTSWNYAFNTSDSTVSKTAKKSMALKLYNDINNPFTVSLTKDIWPIYYTYTFDTATGLPTDSTIIPPDSTILLDSFVVEIIDNILSHYEYFKVYSNRGLINTTSMIDENEDGEITINPETWGRDEDNNEILQGARYGNTALVTMPVAAIDDDGNIFLIYTAPVETAVSIINNENFRDVYVTYSKDNGQTWANAQNISKNPFAEDVFATVGKRVDNYLHLTFQEDEFPGTEVQNQDDPSENSIYYVKVPVDDILNDLIGAFTRPISIKENNFSLNMSVYPNPVSKEANISLTLENRTKVNIELFNVVGQKVIETTKNLNAGNQNIKLNTHNLDSGIYMLKISVNGNSSTQRLIVE